MKDFTNLLEELRSQSQMSKKQLAHKASLSAGYISLLTRGDREAPSEDTVAALADALNLEGEVRTHFFKAAGYAVHPRHATSVSDERRYLINEDSEQEPLTHEDWDGAPDVRIFHGRQQELVQLKQLISDNGECQVVAIVGIGGIGKTALATKLALQIKDQFEYIYWRSLQNAPRLENWLRDCIQFLLPRRVELPEQEDRLIAMFVECLREHACLIVFDNFETVLQDKERAGHYLKGYEGYGRLIQRLSEVPHQSCILLTSREKPREIAFLEGITSNSLVRSLQLGGMSSSEGLEVLKDKGLVGSPGAYETLIQMYAGNPLALKLVSAPIREVFNGNIDNFLVDINQESDKFALVDINQESSKFVFGDILGLLQDQFARLSEREQELLYWLAIEREAVLLNELRENIARLVSRGAFLETLESLRRRSIIESIDDNYDVTRFTLQPVIKEYVISQFVAQIQEELRTRSFKLFASHALLKAQSKEYVKEGQHRFILKPVADWMKATFGKAESEEILRTALIQLHKTHSYTPNYVAGNVLNLLIELKCNLRNYDFSALAVWQADLSGISLPEVDFTNADLTGSIFTDAFGMILSVGLSPDGTLLAAGTSTGEVRLWDAATGTPMRTFQGHTDWVYSIDFSPDGRTLATGSEDQTVRIWEVSTGRQLKIFTGHTNRVYSVTFNHDGSVLASGSHDGNIRLWRVGEAAREKGTESCLMTLGADEKRVWSVAFSLDGTCLASGNENQTVQLWEVSTGQRLKVLSGHEGFVRSVAFNPHKPMLVSGSDDGTIRLWDIATEQCIRILSGHTNRVRAVAFSPDGQQIVSSSDDQTIRLWDVNDGHVIRIFEGHTDWVSSVVFSADGSTIVSSSDDQTVRIWEVQTGARLKTLLGYALLIESIAFSPDGNMLASGGDDQIVRLWNLQDGSNQTLEGHTGWIRSVAFSHDGRFVASSSDDQTIRLWDVRSGRSVKVLRGHTNRVWSVSFSPGGNLLASSSEDQTVRLWNVSTGRTIRTLQGRPGWIWSVAFSLDGNMLASAGADQKICLWDVNTGRLLKDPLEHSNRIWSVSFSPDDSKLVSGCEDQNIHIWDVKTEQELSIMRGHSHLIWSVAFSPDSKIVVSGSADQTVQLWNVETGKCITILNEHGNQVKSVAFSPTGTIFASGSHDGTIKIWDAITYKLLRTLKSDRPYESMKITNVAGLTEAQIATLIALGAIRDEE